MKLHWDKKGTGAVLTLLFFVLLVIGAFIIHPFLGIIILIGLVAYHYSHQ